jgi:hypothetical protein
MAKKDFSQADPGALYQSIAQATAEKGERIFTEEEKVEMLQSMKTRGQKGVKLPRINVAFSPEVYDYVTTMAQVRGQSITQFINHILKQNMEANMEIYEKAIEFRNSL